MSIEVQVEALDELHEALLKADVVEDSPGLRELVEEYWPELLHKIKPPRSNMH